MNAQVTDTKERVFMDHIPRLEWGKGTDNSFIKSAQLALNALGEDYSYTYMMGISGAAFRFHFHPEWCPSAADSTTGFDVSRVLFKSLGYKSDLHSINDKSLDDIRSLYQKIKNQIDRGKPIVAINLKTCPEWGIITGYLKNRPGILCRTYFDESVEYSLAEHAPWLTFFIGEKGIPLADEVLFKNSLIIAAELAKTEAFGVYYSGFHALKKWREELWKYAESLKGDLFEAHAVNLTLFISLLDSRQAAVEYMEMMRGTLKLKKGDSIIEGFRKEVNLLKDTGRNLLPSFREGADRWTPEIIRKQAEVLDQILSIEKEIISLIEKEIK